MTRDELTRLLAEVAKGDLPPEEAARRLEARTFQDLGFAKPDHQRALRLGFPEVVFGQGKTPEQLAAICQAQLAVHPRLLATRVEPSAAAQALAACPGGQHHPLARCVTWGLPPEDQGQGRVVVAAAGTSDLPVAMEAELTARMMGARVERLTDVGVAGLHRLLAHQHTLAAARVVVAVAGMEGALPSVVGGLVGCPVIAVPTDVGYGASFGGLAALLAMLNSCAPGVTVVNIGNGFGAGYAAARINQLAEP
ncbi:MAG: nickel pincer cofactor biosynthesis protein LarB [Deltaproteobacteria bacterium]|nr:nickel pincer cofactor biosynthesis protein LarB [Deltaproteobacteria bacterium]